jgi:hypothetical protein
MSELKHAVELACSDDVIYSGLDGDDTVTWNTATGDITVNITDTDADDAMTDEITAVIGTTHKVASKEYENSTYTITIGLDDDNNVEITDEITPNPGT